MMEIKDKVKIMVRQPDKAPDIIEVDREDFQDQQNNRRILEDQGI